MKKSIYLYAYGLSGGNGLNVVRIANHLKVSGWEVSLIYNKSDQRCLNFCSKEIEHYKLPDNGLLYSIFNIAKLLRSISTPSVYMVSGGSYAAIFILAMKLARRKAPLLIRECVSPSLMISKDSRFYWIKSRLLSFSYNNASKNIAITEAMKEDMIKRFYANADSISVIYNGVEFNDQELKNNDHHKIKGKEYNIHLLNVGRLVKQKNQALLLEAFSKLSSNYTLSIVGEGALQEDLIVLSKKLGIEDRVAFHGYQANVAGFYKSADAFVLSSDFEGFPNVLVEALYYGCQVISTDCPTGPAEILNNGEYGQLVPCGDAKNLALAIQDSTTSPLPGKLLQSRAKQYTVLAQVEAFEKELLRLI